MGKRKRSSEAQETGSPATKRQVVEKVPSASAAERRQLRSERKSKKGNQAKENALKKRSKTATEPELLLPGQSAATGSDDIAKGEDFVPLSDATKIAPTPHLSGTSAGASRPTAKGKEKKRPRSERKEAMEAKATNASEEEHGAVAEATAAGNKKNKDATRFICFVGNLPYNCTTEQIQQHFRKLAPTSIRHSTDKLTRKSKGFAFLEFDDYSKMKTCLKVYHHSIFDPERTSKLPDDAFDENGLEKEVPQSKKQTGRKINVELTAGGGGKGAERKGKIQKKNTKLWEERERRKLVDMKQQKGKDNSKKVEKSEANSTEIGSEAVHPSRLRRVHQ